MGYQLPAIGNSRTVSNQASPVRQRPVATSQHEGGHRRKTSITPNLRVPSSVKTPQEGLPQLAAEVTCLFWFENSSTLKQVLESNSPRLPVQPLVPDAIPTTGFRKWVTTILATTQVAPNVVILALLFIHRLKKTNPSVKGKPGSEYRLLTVALMLGNKFLDDNTYTNKTWAEVSGISVQEVHIMEVEFLSNMRYNLFTSMKNWEEWHITLGKFGTYFDRASKLGAISPLGPPTPALQLPPNMMPSPPNSQPASSPTTMSWSPCCAPPTITPHLLPQTTSTSVSPIGPLPQLGPLIQRKRSADQNADPVPKRQAHGFTPGPYSNSMPIPTLQAPINRTFDAPSMNRLPPLPSLSIPPPQSNTVPVQVHNWSELPPPPQQPAITMPPTSRAMASVYPPPVQWTQPFTTPTSTAAPPYPPSRTPTAGDRSRQVSPYPTGSANSSPTTTGYPNQRQLSPSYFLAQRQSPYRPVRGVMTLLVPPPPMSMHNPASQISYDQMQYHPLGRPMNERRVGTLPYTYEAWTENNHYNNHLPIPQQPIFQR